MVTFIGKGKERTFHSRFQALMSYYASEPVACTPASGWEKGQVENQVKTMRGQVFSPRLSFASLADLNSHLALRCQELALKPHPDVKTRSIAEVFNEELPSLRPVGRPFDGYSEPVVRVSSTCLKRISEKWEPVFGQRYARQRLKQFSRFNLNATCFSAV